MADTIGPVPTLIFVPPAPLSRPPAREGRGFFLIRPYDHKTCTILYPLPFPESTRVYTLPNAPDLPDFDASVSAMKIYTTFKKISTKTAYYEKS